MVGYGSTPLANVMATHNINWPSVPHSQKAEGAKSPSVPKLYLATLNVRALKDQEKLEELEYELKETKLKWDIIGLAET